VLIGPLRMVNNHVLPQFKSSCLMTHGYIAGRFSEVLVAERLLEDSQPLESSNDSSVSPTTCRRAPLVTDWRWPLSTKRSSIIFSASVLSDTFVAFYRGERWNADDNLMRVSPTGFDCRKSSSL
jgi:hypothetical protein